MIAYLRGTIVSKQPNRTILETAGVGYEVQTPVSAFTQLGPEGETAALHIFTHVREDTLALFGFCNLEEKALFERLIAVSGIGPKLAVTILSGLPVRDLMAVIRAGDVKRLTKLPGVGKKTAERMVLELREKLGGSAEELSAAVAAPAPAGIAADVVSALVNLGCQADAAEKAVAKARQAGTPEEFDPLFRRALEFTGR